MEHGREIRGPAAKAALGLALVLTLLPQIVHAELKGGDRSAFVKNFGLGCTSSQSTGKLIESLGGTAADKADYCGCVANAYADRLSVETLGQIRKIDQLSLADWSRRLCLGRGFPDKGPFQSDTAGRQYYPADAETIKALFSQTKDPRTILSADVAGPGAMAQIILFDAKAGLFCWSEPLSIEKQMLTSTGSAPVISALWCETGAGGYVEVYRGAPETYVVGFSLEDGRSGEQTHEIKLD